MLSVSRHFCPALFFFAVASSSSSFGDVVDSLPLCALFIEEPLKVGLPGARSPAFFFHFEGETLKAMRIRAYNTGSTG